MASREDLRAIARQSQQNQFAESTKEQQALTTAQLGAIDPNTGLDIVAVPDGGTVTAQRIFTAGHPTGTFVRATQAPGGQVTLDWRNAPDIPELVDDDPVVRSFSRKKEVDPADIPVLFITKETKEEAIDCRCTTYKRNDEGKFKELCDGSGDKLPGGGNVIDQSLISMAATPSWFEKALTEVDTTLLEFTFLASGGTPQITNSFLSSPGLASVRPTRFGTNVAGVIENSQVAQQFRDLLKQGSSVVIRLNSGILEQLSDSTIRSFEASLSVPGTAADPPKYAASDPRLHSALLASATVFCDEILKPLGINLAPLLNAWQGAGDPESQPNQDTYSGRISSVLSVTQLNQPHPVSSITALIVAQKILIRPMTGGGLSSLLVNLGATINNFYFATLNASNVPNNAGYSNPPFNYSGGGDRVLVLGFSGGNESVAVGDSGSGYVFVWQGRDLDPSFSGVVILDAMPMPLYIPSDSLRFVRYNPEGLGEDIRLGEAKIEQDAKSARPSYALAPPAMVLRTPSSSGEINYYTSPSVNQLVTRGFRSTTRGSSMSFIHEDLVALRKNAAYAIPPRQNNIVKPTKESIVFWLGGCYKTPIKVAELTADDPYEAYLSNTPEKIFITIKASKEIGYKDLPLKRRPWCTIATWEIDKATGTLSAPQEFRNPEEVTTNQDDWQKIWAHDYNPIDPVQVKPAKFNIPTTRFGVSTANQTFNLTPFIQGSDPGLVPKLVDIVFVSVTAGGSGSVLSWNADALTFVYKGNTASLYTIVFNYTVDDGASTATSTITLNGSMIVPNLLYSFSSSEPNSINLTPQTYNIGAGDSRGNVPQVLAGRTRTLVSVEFESVGVEAGSTQQSNGSFFTTSARFGAALSFNPLGSFTGFNAGALTMVWADNYVRNGRPFGGYTAKLRYTISDGFEERTGIIFVYISIEAGSFG